MWFVVEKHGCSIDELFSKCYASMHWYWCDNSAWKPRVGLSLVSDVNEVSVKIDLLCASGNNCRVVYLVVSVGWWKLLGEVEQVCM